ncbi:uncharacterized protein J4E88_007923 [Alternaria novae-zelandiae]|uniref:uncharacterized protein n=1 Tax=Alternaria novae-zelandiae TaxID=430562 RepID=UPI0020C2B115|nr:uncharacterized protein J4E88_007923 [Alternaria novae-zelandiae]KAI4675019.1 hypothetical protein J4E88_007923 [Alternaria novae-zelandiae]
MSSIFRIVLRDAKRYDTYETREFDLPLNSEFPIGRASSNAAKRELMAAPHNAFIDSPVISRQHAVLSANANSGVPEVYITDKGSMHGTMLNGQRLSANTPTKLNDGDVLQFGTDVNRNEEFFVARTYTFESQLSRPFSLGFTVPDAESDEEEVAERRGSQIDPFVIDDDSDAADDHSEADDQEEVTMIMDQVLHPNEHDHTLSVGQDDYPTSAMRTTLPNEDYNPESFASRRDDSLEPASPNPSSDEEDVAALGSDSDSEAGSIDSSEMLSDSEPEIQDSEDEEMEEVEHKKSTTSSSNKENEASIHSQVPQTVHSFPRDTPTLSLSDVYMPQDVANTQQSLPRLYMFGMQGSDSNSMSNSNVYGDNAPPPLPPRPSASRAAPWCDSNYRSFREVADLQEWYSEGVPPNYLGTNFGDRPSLFSPAPLAPMAEANEARAPMPQFTPYPSQPMQASRLQTPPPYFVPDFETSPPVQPGRRTKVSIEEIVEEQPPTPESVKDLKRKADVLEADEPEAVLGEASKAVIDDELATSNSVAAAPVNDAAAIQTAAIIAQRPKKTPRSVLSKVLNKAAYPLLGATGAVVSFALLSTLPDAFFV